MLLLFLIVVLIAVALLLFFCFKSLKWMAREKARMKWAVILLIIFGIAFTIKEVFFTPMEFIQSKVYPDLYLVKNPVNDTIELQKAIKQFVIENAPKQSNQIETDLQYDKQLIFRFYTYYKSSNLMVFSDAGTAYFVENEEDSGGFSVEVLDMYSQYKLATFKSIINKKDTTKYCGILDFYKEYTVTKSDTICNLHAFETKNRP